ncbi:hypothetical protein RP319_01285 [Heyndrickxia coagulans]|uniref:hypothetical protein n=1 Tax=Heyndrickxia coagulans TaxID=1398 RepID=UPI0028FB6FF4|nr:hypothetical protein [Heyndrickxia coagulans]MDT9754826.1 hypothetical protein [Heyndrickxia coagulans]
MEVRFPGVDGKEVVLDLPNYYYDLGYKKGFEEGFKEGLKEGKKAFLQTIVARMLKHGLETQLIVEVTGLSRTEVEKIKQQLENL